MPPKKRHNLKVKRRAIKIVGDTSRVITRLHIPDKRHRINKIGTKTSGTFLSGT